MTRENKNQNHKMEGLLSFSFLLLEPEECVNDAMNDQKMLQSFKFRKVWAGV